VTCTWCGSSPSGETTAEEVGPPLAPKLCQWPFIRPFYVWLFVSFKKIKIIIYFVIICFNIKKFVTNSNKYFEQDERSNMEKNQWRQQFKNEKNMFLMRRLLLEINRDDKAWTTWDTWKYVYVQVALKHSKTYIIAYQKNVAKL